MKINVIVSVGEAIDKYSILLVKSENILDPEKLQHINYEISQMSILKCEEFEGFTKDMVKINQKLWDVNEVRKRKLRDGEFDKEYINLTKQESELNDKRYFLKNAINELFKSDVREQKSYS